jgi:hypothetical protein
MPTPPSNHAIGCGAPHNVKRLAAAIVRGVQTDDDPRTLQAWARATGVSRSALRALCYAAYTRPRSALDLTRTLRVLCRYSNGKYCALDWLDVSDQRGVRRLLMRGGMTVASFTAFTDALSLLRSQTFVSDPRLVAAIIEQVEAEAINAQLLTPLPARLA